MQMRALYRKAHESGREECLLRLVDRNLRNIYDKNEVMRVIKIALLCSNDIANSRPSISQVVSILLGTQDLPEYLLKTLLQTLQSTPSAGLSNIGMWDDTDHEYSNISPIHGGRNTLSETYASGDTSTSRVEPDRCNSLADMEGR